MHPNHVANLTTAYSDWIEMTEEAERCSERSNHHLRGDTVSSPNITFVHPDFVKSTNWRTVTSMGSYHTPISLELKREISKVQVTNRIYVNFAKLDWECFKTQIED